MVTVCVNSGMYMSPLQTQLPKPTRNDLRFSMVPGWAGLATDTHALLSEPPTWRKCGILQMPPPPSTERKAGGSHLAALGKILQSD
jgi:hypothetical protein